MKIRFEALTTNTVISLQNGGHDAYGNAPEHKVSDGGNVPCRHCLKNIAGGEEYLIVAHRPFGPLQPYAETGPIFLHAEPCERAEPGPALPEILDSPDYIVRGYDKDERIVYGTGQVTPTTDIGAYANKLLADRTIEFVHVRSARNNCFQCRIDRQ
jgi:hypothetical protein